MKRLIASLVLLTLAMAAVEARAKTLIVYYSFTNNTHVIVTDLAAQLPDADVLRIEPAEEGLDYAANGYELGSALIAAIRENPDDASSYPAIKPVDADVAAYDEIIVAVPLWWSNMAAPMQTYLFHNGAAMAGKRIGLIVSSASSGISGVEADARRLIPDGDFATPSLWIRSSQTSSCHGMIAEWLDATGLGASSGVASASADAAPSVTCDAGLLMVDGSFDRLDLYDTAGQLVLRTSGNRTDASVLAGGVYVAQLRRGGSVTAVKLLVDGGR